MGTRIKHSFIFKFALIICIFFVSALNSYAYNNSLSGIDINQIQDKYNITLKLDKSVNVKKILQNDKNLTLILNSTIPADSVDIIYDNTSGIDNVIVQKKNKDNTIIYVEGNNLNNAQIYTKDLSTGLIKKSNNSIDFINTNFYISDYKYITYSILGFIFLFIALLFNRPKNRKYNSVNTSEYCRLNTLRNKNNSKSRYIPSINYNISKSNMTVPKEFRISQLAEYEKNEQIRKAG